MARILMNAIFSCLLIICGVQSPLVQALNDQHCPPEITFHPSKQDLQHSFQEIRMLMTTNERSLLLHHMQKSHIYFEFGAGGSTEMACRLNNIKKMIIVEGSLDFLTSLISESKCLRNNDKILPQYVDIGPVGDWTVPTNKATRHLWRNYSTSIMQLKDWKPDLILVDGRFRVACVLSTLLALDTASIQNATIIVHDFFDRYYKYESILQFTTLIQCVDRLAVLQPVYPIMRDDIISTLELFVHEIL